MLSKEKADKLKVWDEISAACERDELIEGTITQRVKGGLAVTIRGGVKAFLPGSQVDLRPVRNLDRLLGQTFQFKVIKFNKKRGNIVLSRRVLLEKERDRLKEATLENLQEGQVVTGTIKNITEYGAFVDLGGIDGLLHITDMSWGRVNHPSEVFEVGNEVTVKVLKYNADTERVSLGLKQTMEDPWNVATDIYVAGKKVKGKVVSLTDYGAFIELEQGVEGLIHVSEMTWAKPKHPSKVLEVGQEVECVVLDLDAQNKRISLGLKQLEPDPWTVFTQKYNPGDIIQGRVRSITDYGVFVGIEDGVDGMVHKSDVSWTQRINNPADLYRKGDEVEAIILSINHDDRKVSLGIKQLYEDPWSFVPAALPRGHRRRGSFDRSRRVRRACRARAWRRGCDSPRRDQRRPQPGADRHRQDRRHREGPGHPSRRRRPHHHAVASRSRGPGRQPGRTPRGGPEAGRPTQDRPKPRRRASDARRRPQGQAGRPQPRSERGRGIGRSPRRSTRRRSTRRRSTRRGPEEEAPAEAADAEEKPE